MGYWEYFGNAPCLIRPSRVESERFQLRVCRAVSLNWGRQAPEFFNELTKCECDVVILRVKESMPDLNLAEPDFRSINAGRLVYWSSKANPAFPELESHMNFVSAKTHVDDFCEIVGDSFLNYVNHYSFNPLLSKLPTNYAYLDWAKSRAMSDDPNHFAGLLVVENQFVGAISGIRIGGVVEVELAGIRSDFQGRGLYGFLIGGLWRHVTTSAESKLVISTQVENLDVQSAWRKLGLVHEFYVHTTHLVHSSLLP